MDSRFLFVGVVILLAVLGLVVLFSVPLGIDHSEGPVVLGDSEEFVSAGQISSEDQLLVRHDATVTNDTAHTVLEYENGTVESVYRDGVVYTKHVTHVDNEDWFERNEPATAEIIHSGEYQDRFIRISKENGTFDSSEIGSVRSMTYSGLSSADYEKTGEQSDPARIVYSPESTWMKLGSDTQRISSKSGDLKTDPETGIVRTASLRVTVTEVSSYGEFLFFSDDGDILDVQYEYDPEPDIDQVEKPSWFRQCVENDQCEF
ncbi:hypothetical protein G6M89_17980 [Natronolimnobius sp. AArcel1]|uniref:hypothetical protein n=1 Tax=Natronolimnobius sp. AArcel1 TaxID=1679093 RepID=UPI0013EA86AF|nr:hypothetical protein [Natronolimnobius sp. AArcel1]NGM70867.1 hypothetical protein [Natronolimnobius sp. AArcel1]